MLSFQHVINIKITELFIYTLFLRRGTPRLQNLVGNFPFHSISWFRLTTLKCPAATCGQLPKDYGLELTSAFSLSSKTQSRTNPIGLVRSFLFIS